MLELKRQIRLVQPLLSCKEFRVHKESSKCQNRSIQRMLWDHGGEETTPARQVEVGGGEKERKVGTKKVLAEILSELGSEG